MFRIYEQIIIIFQWILKLEYLKFHLNQTLSYESFFKLLLTLTEHLVLLIVHIKSIQLPQNRVAFNVKPSQEVY